MAKRIRAGPFRPLFYFETSWKRAYKKVHAFVDKNVQAALRHQSVYRKAEKCPDDGGKKEKYIILQEMALQMQDPVALRGQIMNIFLPARDTSAMAITNVMFELARHPEIWEALRAEVEGIGEQPLTFELIKNLKLAKAIVNETLRLHPPATMAQRVALRDTILPVGGGLDQLSPLFVPKGTVAFSHMYALHKNPEYWGEDVEEFKPERWGEGRPLWEAKWQYVPFFGGIRMCPAQQMVLTQVTYLLVRLAQEFKGLENRDEVSEWLGLIQSTVQSKNGAKVSLTPV
jgi:cytochrome P450